MKTLTIDIETTGIPPKNADYKLDYDKFPWILSVSIKVDDNKTETFLLNQEGRLIPEEATKANGITDEMLKDTKLTFKDVLNRLVTTEFSDVKTVIGHNVYFDTSIIKANALRLNGGDLFEANYVVLEVLLDKEKRFDTMQKAPKICGIKPYSKLTDLYRFLFNEDLLNAHTSEADVEATYRVYQKLTEMSNGMPTV